MLTTHSHDLSASQHITGVDLKEHASYSSPSLYALVLTRLVDNTPIQVVQLIARSTALDSK